MRTLSGIILSTLFITLALFSNINSSSLLQPTSTTTIRFFPQPQPFTFYRNEEFTVACVVEDVSNLYGMDFRISWDPSVLTYINHTTTFPKEDYPTPIPPSPYAGILWKEPYSIILVVKDDVSTTAGTYWLAATSLQPAPSFNGSGTVFIMSFRAPDYSCTTQINFTTHVLVDSEFPQHIINNVQIDYELIVDSRDWPMFHHDPNHTGSSSSSAPNTNNTLWKYATKGEVWSSPTIAEGRVYVGTEGSDDRVYCLDAETGVQIWNFTTGSGVFSSPAFDNSIIFFGTYDYKVYSLNATTGTHIWNFTTSGVVGSSPTVYENKVYVGAENDGLYCLNATTGTQIWKFTPNNGVWSSPAVSNDRVYFGSDDYNIYCLNALTGVKIWNYTTSFQVESSPTIFDNKLFVGGEDGKVYCLNASTGAHLWNYTTGGLVWSSPAISDNRVYIGSLDNKIYCLNASTGAHLWDYTTGDWIESSPAVADGKVLIGSDDYKVYCLNASSGALIWDYLTEGFVSSSPAVSGGKVYVGSVDGNVYVFGLHHDIAVTKATIHRKVVGQGSSVAINFTVENQGEYTETFTITIYANLTEIYEIPSIALLSKDSANFNLTWDTTGFPEGNYSIRVLAQPVPGEIELLDNEFLIDSVFVTITGDVDGDQDVDIFDIVAIAGAYGSEEGDSAYNPNYDIDGDGDIDIFDIVLAASHYGENW